MDSYGKKAGKGALIQEEISGTLGVSQDQYLFQPIAYHCTTDSIAHPLKARDYKDPLIIVMDRAAYNQGENAKYDFEARVGGVSPPLIARGPGAVCYRITMPR